MAVTSEDEDKDKNTRTVERPGPADLLRSAVHKQANIVQLPLISELISSTDSMTFRTRQLPSPPVSPAQSLNPTTRKNALVKRRDAARSTQHGRLGLVVLQIGQDYIDPSYTSSTSSALSSEAVALHESSSIDNRAEKLRKPEVLAQLHLHHCRY
ncbi:uncharacterized protein FOMMEDRAFT_160319 [Fomitiporia mediterranea MF3/22]|uniref:uncharacterized protein n=1 Tax=Fomitiporia mediterranea (strain MF3/22) TaxID=694068 RepID=UPI000440886B|nr:uncharacterized protein FOMMEDRAFT_160319 [Fomitiporia mediterranea MF3/22]EJC99865.1 hypothetical protein FOMMEDRAFT_160319 [Fomitiporia mediterranea MF3/22]